MLTMYLKSPLKLGKARSNAFTLIELLVVVSIISLLSSTVLAGFQSARKQARIASIKQQLGNAQTQATLYFNQNGTYAGLCKNKKMQRIVSVASSTGKGAGCFTATQLPGYRYSYVNGKELALNDFGVAAKFDEIFYLSSSNGVGTLSSEDIEGSKNYDRISWDAARQKCKDNGGRLPSPSALHALFKTYDSTYAYRYGFRSYYYWSDVESFTGSNEAYSTDLGNGSVATLDKPRGVYARCVK